MKRSGVRWLLLVLVLSLTCACQAQGRQGATTLKESTAAPLTGQVTFAGSTTVQPLAADIGQAFNQRHPGVRLEIAAGGSGVGIKAVHEGTVDIGMSSRRLKSDEQQGIEIHQIAVDVIAIVVNPANPVSNLSLGELRGIYLGEITNWAELGGADSRIQVVVRETTSGTRKAFDELVLGDKEPAAPHLESLMTAGDVAAFVGGHGDAIGYLGFGNLEDTLKAVLIDGTAPTAANGRDGSYSLTRPLLLLTGPLSQPLAMEYIRYALSEAGQKVVVDSGWIPAE
jgi:phosphate transport system substrate-binding protein